MVSPAPSVPLDLLAARPPGFPRGAALQDEIRRYLATRYDLCEHPVRLGDRTIHVLGVRDTNALVDALTPDDFAVDERLPFWAEIWSAARGLAARMLVHPGLEHTRVLELGCGLGLAGTAAALAGAAVTMTDYEVDALLFARCTVLSVLPPEAAARVGFRLLDWREPPSLEPYPLVLGADLLYERRMFGPLLGCLETLLAPDGCALLADPDRSTAGEFLERARGRGFRIASVIDSIAHNGRSCPITTHRLSRQ